MFKPSETVFLDDLPAFLTRVGYGELGRNGCLGYENQRVQVAGEVYTHALSSHPPAHLGFHLDRRFETFQTRIAINGDVPRGRTAARFAVYADGHCLATETVDSGDSPRDLRVDVSGCHLLELVVEAQRWEHCHAVWLNPQLAAGEMPEPVRFLSDSLRRVRMLVPALPLRARRCVATVVSPGFESLADEMLSSLTANGNCDDALRVMFAIGGSQGIDQLVAKHGVSVVQCEATSPVNASIKSVLYSLARVVDADAYLAFDADTVILGDLTPVFAAVEALPENAILACREGNDSRHASVRQVLTSIYGGQTHDLFQILGSPDLERDYEFVVNDGVFAGRRSALLALDRCLREMPGAASWLDQRLDIPWRNQFLFNLALAKLNCGIELDGVYNLQLIAQDVTASLQNGRLRARWNGRPVHVLHFNGSGRNKLPEWRGHFSRIADPLVSAPGGDAYAQFLAALRSWIGRYGRSKLAWSFYGTADAGSSRVRDTTTFPLLACLHYMLRSHGCVRILETGTARGVSTACLASAVAHRQGGRVVTLDLAEFPQRSDLWAGLPASLQDCIEPRLGDCLAEMRQALERGEQFDAALLDTVHTAEHVWQEFELATQLVRPGGLILVHDVCYPFGTVAGAIDRIQAAGYGVVRLWTDGSAVREDDNLGLAVIENRRLI